MTDGNPTTDAYELLDSGGGRLLEQLGSIVSARPCPPAWWRRRLGNAEWKKAVDLRRAAKEPLRLRLGAFRFLLNPNGSLRALAPELIPEWELITSACTRFTDGHRRPARVLNLFGGNAGATLAAGKAGAAITHVDSSADGVARAQENAQLNPEPSRSVRWLVDDPVQFAKRERTQTTRYDLIVIDPQAPRDAKRGFDLERDLVSLLNTVSGLLSDQPIGVMLFCRQGSVSPTILLNIMRQEFSVFGGSVESGELLLKGAEGVPTIPAGSFAHWWKEVSKAKR